MKVGLGVSLIFATLSLGCVKRVVSVRTLNILEPGEAV